MQTIRLAFGLAFAALALYVIAINYFEYRKTAGAIWERLLATAKNSATLLWSQFCMLLAGLIGSLDTLADLAGMPELKTFIDTWLGNPKLIAAIMLVITLITIKARTRTL